LLLINHIYKRRINMKRLISILCLLSLGVLPAFSQTYQHVAIQDIQKDPIDSLLVADTLQSSTTRFKLQASPYYHDTLETTGIVVVPKGIMGYNNSGWSILLYDTANVNAWRGLWVKTNVLADSSQAKLDGFDALEAGDVVTIRGWVDEFPTGTLSTLTQLVYLPGKSIVPIGKVTVPPPVKLDVATFYQGPYTGGKIRFSTGEQYESMVVELTNLVIPSYSNATNGTFNMVQNGNQISMYDVSDYYTLRRPNPSGWTYKLPPIQASIDTIRGVIWTVSGGDNSKGYEIAPMLPGDLVVGAVNPAIITARRTPMVPRPTDSAHITVKAYQQSGGAPIDSVKLFYKFNYGPFVAMQMTPPAGDSTWRAVIPPAPDSTFVRYFIKAYDHAGKTTPLASYSSNVGSDTASGFFFYESMNRPLTLKDIQYTPFPNAYSPYAADTVTAGALVTVSGTITADTSDIYLSGNPASTVGGTYGWYMQTGNAPWSGIWIVGDTTMYPLHHGDSVSVTGNVEEWFSFGQRVTTRISGIHAPVVLATGRTIPSPLSKSTSAFASFVAHGASVAEPFEGMLVKFTNVTVTNVSPYFSDQTWYEIDSLRSNGSSLGAVWVHRDGRNSYTNIPADTLTHPTWKVLRAGNKISTLTGIVHFSVNRYKLVPRTDADFGTITGIGSVPGKALPVAYALEQNYPNPFNPSTVIEFKMPTAGIVSLKVYNILGQVVTTLAEGMHPAGNYSYRFEGQGLSSGVYFYRLQTGSFVQVRKMMLLK
jgi:hypothetical protein